MPQAAERFVFMRKIIALAPLFALASLSVPALAASTASASVSVPQPSCESGLSTTTCRSGAPNPPATVTWTLDGGAPFSGSHSLKFGCEPGLLDYVSFSYVLSGVTYVSGTASVLCQSAPYM
jgi:hypothetical protein